jgi:predicted deacylase
VAGRAAGEPTAIGQTPNGQPIPVYEVGDGPRRIAFVGGIRHGAEANTVELVELLLRDYLARPDDVPIGVTLAFIPSMNPDSGSRGDRYNANNVDLNRNWPYEWSPDTNDSSGFVEGWGGKAPFSEPETRALQQYLVGRQFAAVIFFHSQAGMVVTSQGGGSSEALARVAAEATGCQYVSFWSAYPVSGQAIDYLDAIGMVALDVELSTPDDPQFERNLRGVQAAVGWVFVNTSERIDLSAAPLPEPAG